MNNGTATVTPIGDYPPFTYHWFTDPVQTTQIAVNLPSGIISVRITDSVGCSITVLGQIGQTSNVETIKESQFQIYPNPSSGEVFLEIEQSQRSDWHLTLTDTSGKLLKTEKGNGSKKLQINDLVTGVYLAKLSFGEEFITKKLVIQP